MCKISVITPPLSDGEKQRLFNDLKKTFNAGKNSIHLHETRDDCNKIALDATRTRSDFILIRKTSENMAGCYAEKINSLTISAPPIFGLDLIKKKKAEPHPKIGLVIRIVTIEDVTKKINQNLKTAQLN